MPVNQDDYLTAFEKLFEKAQHIRQQAQELCAGLVDLQAAYASELAGDADLVDEETEAHLLNRLGRTSTPSDSGDQLPRPRASRGIAEHEHEGSSGA